MKGWDVHRLIIDWFRRKFRSLSGFLRYLVTCLGFLLWCYGHTYLDDDKVATVYRRSSHNDNNNKITCNSYSFGIHLITKTDFQLRIKNS